MQGRDSRGLLPAAIRWLIFLIFKKGDFTMQAKKTNPEKAKNPEMLTLDSTYRIGHRSFIVEPVFKEESSQTLGEVLLRLMKSESEKL